MSTFRVPGQLDVREGVVERLQARLGRCRVQQRPVLVLHLRKVSVDGPADLVGAAVLVDLLRVRQRSAPTVGSGANRVPRRRTVSIRSGWCGRERRSAAWQRSFDSPRTQVAGRRVHAVSAGFPDPLHRLGSQCRDCSRPGGRPAVGSGKSRVGEEHLHVEVVIRARAPSRGRWPSPSAHRPPAGLLTLRRLMPVAESLGHRGAGKASRELWRSHPARRCRRPGPCQSDVDSSSPRSLQRACGRMRSTSARIRPA